jgi:enoyl-CoA hydratase/carnithine racemase
MPLPPTRSVRVVVIAGAGKAFCSGHDLKQMRANPGKAYQQKLFKAVRQDDDDADGTAAAGDRAHPRHRHRRRLPAGRHVRPGRRRRRRKFAVSGVNLGLFCSTPSVALGRAMGRKQAMEMLLTGDFIDAAEAQRRGLVNRVVPLDQLDAEVKKLTDSICAKTPVALAMGKQMFYKQLEMGLEGAYQLAAETMACNMMADDAAEGIDAFMQKRKPEWKGC